MFNASNCLRLKCSKYALTANTQHVQNWAITDAERHRQLSPWAELNRVDPCLHVLRTHVSML